MKTFIILELIIKYALSDDVIWMNFKYLDDLIHCGEDEIVLDSDIVLDNAEEMEYFEGINLDADDIVIDGNGFAIDAAGKTRVFLCTAENVCIRNIVLKNGFCRQSGGAVLIEEGEALFCDVNPTPVKQAMNLLGMDVGPCRLPLYPMNESNLSFLKEKLIECGFKI